MKLKENAKDGLERGREDPGGGVFSFEPLDAQTLASAPWIFPSSLLLVTSWFLFFFVLLLPEPS